MNGVGEKEPWSWVPVVGGIVALFVLALGFCMPNFVRGGSSRTFAIINNLRRLDGATQQWAIDRGLTNEVKVTMEDIMPYLRGSTAHHSLFKSLAGEKYIVTTIAESPQAELTRKLEGWPKGTLFRLGTNGDEISLPDPQGGTNARQPFVSRLEALMNRPSR